MFIFNMQDGGQDGRQIVQILEMGQLKLDICTTESLN